MGGTSKNNNKDYPWHYLAASALAAAINYPLWRASAVGQSGFTVSSATFSIATRTLSLPPSLSPYVHAFSPPYKGMLATVLGMAWARAAIFYGSDHGRDRLRSSGAFSETVATVVPPLVVSTLVQFCNMPLVRATVTIQNPQCSLETVSASIRHIYQQHGIRGLWHGTSAGILKTVPKYLTAIVVKDVMEDSILEPVDPCSPTYQSDVLYRSACKSAAAGIAGAALTNPLDVIRNEMFKTNRSLRDSIRHLYVSTPGLGFVTRGLGHNLVAVAVPLSCTIFFTDALIQWTEQQRQRNSSQ